MVQEVLQPCKLWRCKTGFIAFANDKNDDDKKFMISTYFATVFQHFFCSYHAVIHGFVYRSDGSYLVSKEKLVL